MSRATTSNPAAPATGKRVTRRRFMGAAVGTVAVAGGYSVLANHQYRADKADGTVDVLLIGGGIMSATLGVYLSELEPAWTFEVFERLDKVAEESSNGWNNAGTGHSALCELNYTPMDDKGRRAHQPGCRHQRKLPDLAPVLVAPGPQGRAGQSA